MSPQKLFQASTIDCKIKNIQNRLHERITRTTIKKRKIP